MLIAFKNAGELPTDSVRYLSQTDHPWSGPINKKGLIIVKGKLKALKWKLASIKVDAEFTTIAVAISLAGQFEKPVQPRSKA